MSVQSSLIGKIEKARVYARERHRMQVKGLQVEFSGENGDHSVGISDGAWTCTCDFFSAWTVCSHTMALERVLEGMVPNQILKMAEAEKEPLPTG
ncbi:MAG TPA: hypothetical protein QGF35_02840 [Dehalococcoidia bacterium]|nr:hypothetical protein [Dehalococcoidia bacterium]